MESYSTESADTEAPALDEAPEPPTLIVSVEEVPVARERCAAVGKNGNNRVDPEAS